MTGRGANAGVRLIQLGLVVLVPGGLVATTAELGDCGGSVATCEAAPAAGQARTRILVALLVVTTGLAVVAWRNRGWIAQALLAGASSVMLALAFATLALWAGTPEWVPTLIGLTAPGSGLLAVGAFRRLQLARRFGG